MNYIKRIIEDELLEKLSASGAVLIKGPKSCGKTATAKQYAKSILEMDRDKQVPVMMATSPQHLLKGNTPRLIDEWQEQPEIWNYVRHEVDERNTISEYIDALSRLMILYEQPAFNPHIRSSASLRKSPKRHLCDPSLAVAALGLNEESLANDIKFTGFLFESLAVHELNVYAKANDANVFHYNDSYGLEVDAIVQKRNGDYAAFEIKLGVGYIDEAAKILRNL